MSASCGSPATTGRLPPCAWSMGAQRDSRSFSHTAPLTHPPVSPSSSAASSRRPSRSLAARSCNASQERHDACRFAPRVMPCSPLPNQLVLTSQDLDKEFEALFTAIEFYERLKSAQFADDLAADVCARSEAPASPNLETRAALAGSEALVQQRPASQTGARACADSKASGKRRPSIRGFAQHRTERVGSLRAWEALTLEARFEER